MWSTSNEEDGKKDVNLFKLFIVRSLVLSINSRFHFRLPGLSQSLCNSVLWDAKAVHAKYLDSIGISIWGHGWTQIFSIFQFVNNNINWWDIGPWNSLCSRSFGFWLLQNLPLQQAALQGRINEGLKGYFGKTSKIQRAFCFFYYQTFDCMSIHHCCSHITVPQ